MNRSFFIRFPEILIIALGLTLATSTGNASAQVTDKAKPIGAAARSSDRTGASPSRSLTRTARHNATQRGERVASAPRDRKSAGTGRSAIPTTPTAVTTRSSSTWISRGHRIDRSPSAQRVQTCLSTGPVKDQGDGIYDAYCIRYYCQQ